MDDWNEATRQQCRLRHASGRARCEIAKSKPCAVCRNAAIIAARDAS